MFFVHSYRYVVLCPPVLPQTGYRHSAKDAHEVASMVVDAADAAEELEVVVVVLAKVRRPALVLSTCVFCCSYLYFPR